MLYAERYSKGWGFENCFAHVVGQCGNQIGSAFWPLVLHEYGVQTNSGGVNFLKTHKSHENSSRELSDAFSSFFHVPDRRNGCAFKSVADLESAKVKARVRVACDLCFKLILLK